MTDTNGNSLGTMKYYPYGSTRSGSVPTDELFTGQKLDGTGLYYYGARYYDPNIGRFISPDTIITNPSDPQSFNRYSYCLNNPLKYIDPSGHTAGIDGVDATLVDDPRLIYVVGGSSIAAVGSTEKYKKYQEIKEDNPDEIEIIESSSTWYDMTQFSELESYYECDLTVMIELESWGFVSDKSAEVFTYTRISHLIPFAGYRSSAEGWAKEVSFYKDINGAFQASRVAIGEIGVTASTVLVGYGAVTATKGIKDRNPWQIYIGIYYMYTGYKYSGKSIEFASQGDMYLPGLDPFTERMLFPGVSFADAIKALK